MKSHCSDPSPPFPNQETLKMVYLPESDSRTPHLFLWDPLLFCWFPLGGFCQGLAHKSMYLLELLGNEYCSPCGTERVLKGREVSRTDAALISLLERQVSDKSSGTFPHWSLGREPMPLTLKYCLWTSMGREASKLISSSVGVPELPKKNCPGHISGTVCFV